MRALFKNRKPAATVCLLRQWICFCIIAVLLLLPVSRSFAAHTYALANVSGLMIRFQLSVLLPDCANYRINWGDGSLSGTFSLLSSGTTNYYHTYAAAGTYNVNLICGGVPDPAQSITVPPPGPDTINPTVTIASPATDPFATAVPAVTLSGTANDNVGVTLVTWSNTTTGASGTAAGTTTWTAAGIPLQAGANTLVITARDAAFNAGTDTVVVTYAAPGAASAAALAVTPVPASAAAIPGRNNFLAVTYRGSAAGSLTARSPRGTFETSGGSVLGSVDAAVTLRVVNGLGIVGESVNLPAAVIAAALDQASNRIFYRRTFNGSVQTEVAFQVLPASAGPLSVKRMELNFLFTDETGRIAKSPRATVPRNSGNLRAVADLQYDGGGTLRGIWKADGQVLGITTRTLYRGIDRVAIESPAVPPLPTYAAGRHAVTFEIQDPPPGFDEPVIFYYVSERAGSGIGGDLVLIEPVPGAAVPMPVGSEKDPRFQWQAVPRQVVYRFELVSPLNLERPIVQAVTREQHYRLSRYDGEQIAAGVDYLWRVLALSGETPVAASTYRPVYVSVRPGGAAGLTLSNFSVVDAGGGIPAGEGPGRLPLFQLQTGGPVRVATLLENASGREAQNVTVQILLDGALYDAFFFQRLAPGDVQEIFSDLELEDARRQTLQVRAFEEGREDAAATIGGAIEGAAGFADSAGAVTQVTTDRLQMTGLALGAPPVRTETLQMTGLAVGAPPVRTETLQMTGLAVGASVVTTASLEMTGLAVGAPVVRSGTIEMVGLSPAPSLRIVQPNGGEQWSANGTYPVLWSAADDLGDIRIRLQRTGTDNGRILVRRISAHFGMTRVDIPSNVLSGNYSLVIETLDGTVRDASDGAISIQGISGFVYPDFDVTDLQYLINPGRLTVRIQNNGVPWEGELPLRVIFHDPDGPFTETRPASLPLSLGPGESQWVDLVNPFAWQTPYDQPRLMFLVEADPNGTITEGDENNNLLQKEIRIPCGLRIDNLSNDMIYRNMPEIFLYGFFGRERVSKRVAFRDVNDPERRYSVYADPWSESSLHAVLWSIPPGIYRAVVYCTDPEQGAAYSSNLSPPLRIRSEREDYDDPIDEDSVDTRKTIDALSEEFMDGVEFQWEIEELWVEALQDGLAAHARILGQQLAKVVFEVWDGPVRKRYAEIREFQPEGGFGGARRYHVQRIFQGLEEGRYTLRCRAVKETGGGDAATITFQAGAE